MRHYRVDNRVLAIAPPDSYTRLYMDFVCGKMEGLEALHVAFREPAAWQAHARRKLAECRATPELWREVGKLNRHLRAAAPTMENIESLAAGGTVAIVGGQQPGLLGGPLLVIYKAATAIAMAERFKEATGVPCAPVFIVSSDDSDFEEIKRCTLFDRSLRRLSLDHPGHGYAAGQVVGSVSAEMEKELAGSLSASVGDVAGPGDDVPGDGFVDRVLRAAAGVAGDHGEFVAAILSALFSAQGLVMIDGRSPEMRRAGGGLFKSYLEKRDELRDAVRAAGEEMAKRGYHAQISGPGLDWWLFLNDKNVRRKIAEGGRAEVERAVDESPETLSPNVALRPPWRDSVLPAVFCICGPSEVAYSLQLRKAYEILEVTPSGLLPRLGVTLVPAEGVEVAGGWTEKDLSSLLMDFEAAVKSHYRSLIPGEAIAALDKAKSAVVGSVTELADSLAGVSEEWGKAAAAVGRLSGKGLEKLENDIVDAVKRDAQSRNPRLKGLGDFLLPDGKLQERTVSALAPFLEEGESFVEGVVSMARSHVRACESGKVRHYCYLMGRTSDA